MDDDWLLVIWVFTLKLFVFFFSYH